MTRVALAAPSRAALDAGLEVAADGGNAVDAALAASLAAMSTEPGIVSLMGGAFVNVWPADGDPVVVDGNVEMPGREVDRSRFGRGIRWVRMTYGGGFTIGAGLGSVANPGAVQALSLARDLHGRLPWQRLVTPAAQLCRDGHPIGSAAAHYLGLVRDTLFGDDPAAHALTGGALGALEAGETTTNTDLADVLELLGAQGPSLFTSGAVGRVLAELMTSGDGLISSADLVAYEPAVRVPTLRAVRGWQLAFNPPPSIGGPVLAAMLGAVTPAGARWSWADVIRAQRVVLEHRRSVLDVAPDLQAGGVALLDAVDRDGLAAVASLRGASTSSSTAHVSAVDADGTACSVTMSSGYGAGMVVPGTGILLNNALGEPELNRLGLHALAPGTRLSSNMAPTTARGPDGQVLAIGSPGADRITTALMQVLGRMLLLGESLSDAIEAPRLHVRYRDGDGGGGGGARGVVVEHEPDPDIAAAVRALDLGSEEYPGLHMYFGGVGAAELDAGMLRAAGDSRREAAIGIST